LTAEGAPLVSIVTPSYNQAAYLEETIVSVLEQDYPNIEYIVVDDGSTDGSLDIVERYADRLAWWTRQENAGQVAALNRGFERARGEIVGWLNSDDVFLPGCVSRVVEELERDPDVLLVYGDNVFLHPDGREEPLPARPFDPAEMVRTCSNHVPQPGSLFRRRALQLAPLDERSYYFFDFEFVLRLSEHGRVKRIDEPLAIYRLHPESKSIGAPLRKAADYLRLADDFFAGPGLPDFLRRQARAGRARAYLDAGEYFYAGGDLARARRFLAHALALRPGLASLRSLSLLGRALLPHAVSAPLRRRRAVG
jgi:glycosyltransferase involved in cell wall biosynthesis